MFFFAFIIAHTCIKYAILIHLPKTIPRNSTINVNFNTEDIMKKSFKNVTKRFISASTINRRRFRSYTFFFEEIVIQFYEKMIIWRS